MAGVLFVICIPTETYEKTIKKSRDELSLDVKNISEKNNQSFFITSNENTHPISKSSSVLKTCADLLTSEGFSQKNLPQNKSTDGIEVVTSSTISDKEENDSSLSLEKILREILVEKKIKNAMWTKGESGRYLQVIFPLESGKQCERTLAVLNDYGIGQRLNSVVSVIPCSLYYKDQDDLDKLDSGEEERKKELNREAAKNTAWHRFVTSVRARLTVAQVVESVKADAALTFDFLVLLVIATILSAIALAENNNIYLVSSMLISPMMGPVMAGTFGSVIQDRKLQKIGVLNELIGLGTATAVGFCYGVIITSFTDKYGEKEWPTYEMTSRGEIRTLWVGCLIALLSGAAVALGILGDNIASLVGVAISASLMPPAVNAGLLWAMAVVYACAGENSSKSIVRTHFYSDYDVLELAALGAVSMCLTFVNIVCIYIAGILVFKIKEVAPISSKDQSRRFWKYDIKIARDYNRTLQNEDAKTIGKHLSSKISAGYSETDPLLGPDKEFLNQENVTDHLYQSTEMAREHVVDVSKTQYTWSPSTFAPKRPTIQELKNMYFSLVDEKPKAQKNLNFRFPVSRGLQPSTWINSGPSTEENSLPCIPENITNDPVVPQQRGRKPMRGTRKFVVTPASIDNSSQS